MSLAKKAHRMSAILVEQFCEIAERHTVKKLARALGCSISSAKRYKAEPELFPESRAVELLRAIEQEERLLEARREKRRQQREVAASELRSALGLDGPKLDLHKAGNRSRLAGGEGIARGGDLPGESGAPSEVAAPAARRARP